MPLKLWNFFFFPQDKKGENVHIFEGTRQQGAPRKTKNGISQDTRAVCFPASLFRPYAITKVTSFVSTRVACATDNTAKNVVNHFISIKLTCIIITRKNTCTVRIPYPKMCTWRTRVYHATKLLSIVYSQWYGTDDYSISAALPEGGFFLIFFFVFRMLFDL